MNTSKCTCRCTCKPTDHSDMDNLPRNQYCSQQISDSHTEDDVNSTNFTEEQKNMIMKIEAYNREIIKEIERLQIESEKTNDAINLLKHSNIAQSSFQSPEALQRKVALYSDAQCYNSRISDANTSPSNIKDNSSWCRNDRELMPEGSQQTFQSNNIQLMKQLESLRNRQLKLMSRMHNLKKSRLVLMQHMQQLYEAQKRKSKTEHLNQLTDQQTFYDFHQNSSNYLSDNTSDMYTSSCLPSTINCCADNMPVNTNMVKSFVDRECQTNFSVEPNDKLNSDNSDYEFRLSTLKKHNSLPNYSNNDCCQYTDNVNSNTTSNVSALAMIAAMTAATIFKRTFQQSVCQASNTNSDNLYKHTFEQKNDSAFNSSISSMESPYWSDLKYHTTTTKKDDPIACPTNDYQLYNHVTFSQPTNICNRTDLLPPTLSVPSSTSYYLGGTNPFPSISSTDTSKLNSGLLIPELSHETEIRNSLEPMFIRNLSKSTKIPELNSLKTNEAEYIKNNEGNESKSTNILDNNELHHNSRLTTFINTRDRFSDRILQARQAIDKWNLQKHCDINDSLNQRENLVNKISKQLNVTNEKIMSDQSYSQQSPRVDEFPFCKECYLASDFVSSPISPEPNTCHDCSVQCEDTVVTKSAYSDKSSLENTFTKMKPNASKTMPIQIVKPAVRNQVHSSNASNSIKELSVKIENQINNSNVIQAHHLQQHENRSVCDYKDKKGINDKRQIKGVLIRESSKSERTNKTSRNPSAQRSVAWVDEVLSHPLTDINKPGESVANVNLDSTSRSDAVNGPSIIKCNEKLGKYSNRNNDKNITLTKHTETHQPAIKTITSTTMTTTPRRLLPMPSNNMMGNNE
ncbi:unnamed protein product [Schistosoma turkestanicum]|nr:unnamed protein product [Schistosoma turkestanicum]